MKSKAMVRGTLDVVLMGVVTLGLVALAGCGSSGSGTGGGGGGTTPTGDQNVFVVEGSANGISSILEFAAGSNGSVAPKATLNLPNSLEALSVATDSSGQIYVGGYASPNFEILVYPAGSSGTATPSRTITTSAITDAEPIVPNSMTVDSSGNLYVAGVGGNVAMYSPTANGAVTAMQLITSSVLTGPVGVAVDGVGNIYVSNEVATEDISTGAIYVFAPGSTGNATPTRTITTPNIFYGIAVDSSNNIYTTETTVVTDGEGDVTAASAQIVEFSSTATGAASPTKSITIPNGGEPIVIAGGLRMDSTGNLFTAAQTASGTDENATLVTSVLEFGPSASGNTAPIASFSSSSWIYPGEELAID